MAYFTSLNIPANTTKTSPASTILRVAPCLVKGISVVHPTGCASLAGIWFEYLATKIFPVNDDGFFLGDGTQFAFSPNYVIDAAPYEIRILGYNDDVFYSHRILVMLDIEFSGLSPIESSQLIAMLNS